MSLTKQIQDTLVSQWLSRALRNMSKTRMVKLLDLICTLNPGWKENVAFTTQLIEQEHPFYQWARAMAHDLHPRVFERFLRNAVLDNFVADRRQKDYEAEHGAPPLSNVVISVTERCNLACEGCWASEYDKRDDLPIELLDRIIRELKEMRANFVTFTGGEPFMRKDILDLIEAHPDAVFQIYTNGTLITEKLADRLQALGNAIPLLSINGFEDANDGIRGKGNFQTVVQGLRPVEGPGDPVRGLAHGHVAQHRLPAGPRLLRLPHRERRKDRLGLPVHARRAQPDPGSHALS